MRYLASLMLAVAAPAIGQEFDGRPALTDTELSAMRGGFTLPGGVQVAIGIAIETRVDGTLALRTALNDGGVTVDAGTGVLTVSRAGANTIAQLAGQGIDVSQLVGRATATIIANTGSDRVIDTATTVSIDLSGRLAPSNFLSTLEGAARGGPGR